MLKNNFVKLNVLVVLVAMVFSNTLKAQISTQTLNGSSALIATFIASFLEETILSLSCNLLISSHEYFITSSINDIGKEEMLSFIAHHNQSFS